MSKNCSQGSLGSIEILLVEDNAADARLTLEQLKQCSVSNHVSVVGDGEKAMSFLRRQEGYAHVRRPDLVILDLNLPRKDGRQVLAEMKCDPLLRQIPVIILTTSGAKEDVDKCYHLHANCYLTKPVDLEGFTTVIEAIEDFWLKAVRLPVP
jgi:CheY-like chemotaxis protein